MRPLLIALVTAYLFIAGLWSGAAAPIGLVADGAMAVVNAAPGLVLLGLAVVAYRRRSPQRRTA
ncbi:hypothetical protein [Streptomyces sp. SGAir0957]